jgi:RND superfamily putative drug exporter
VVPLPRWLPRLVTRRPRAVLAGSLVVVVLATVLGMGAFARLKNGGFQDPSSESARAGVTLADRFDVPESNLLVLVTARKGSVDDAAVTRDARALVAGLRAEPHVSVLGDYWDAPAAQASGLRSEDGRRALVVLNVGGDEEQAAQRAEPLLQRYTRATAAATFQTGGYEQLNADLNETITADLARAESFAIPLTIVLLAVAFGALAAAVLPLVVALISIFGTFAVLYAITLITDVSVFSLNLTTALAIGLGVDYSLLIVSRFREELAHRDTPDAVTVTLRTAGRTVLFSAMVVAVALSALMVFPMYFLRSFAFAGVAVVAVAALASLLTVPALLTVLGPRVNRFRVGRRRVEPADGSPFWRGVARTVMRRPLLTGAPVVLLLGVMALPFLNVSFGLPDDRVLPAGSAQARQVADVLRSDFGEQAASAVLVALPAGSGSAPALEAYARRISGLDGVARVDSAVGTFARGGPVASAQPGMGDPAASWLRVVPTVPPESPAAQDLVREIRDLPAPGPALVGGRSAELVDTVDSIGGRLPLAAGLIAVTSFVLLFLFTGSVVLPLKALVINVVSIVAVIGTLTWVFQDGHLSGLLGFTPMPLSLAMVLLMFCVSFGLSMDYEVFLLGRIKERHDAGADTVTAVSDGLARTGRIVSTAAALLAITFFAFLVSDVSFLQMFGLGAGLAVVLDATLVRGVLVPALMRLMGAANWWAPGPLRRLHDRFGLSEVDTDPAEPREPALSR